MSHLIVRGNPAGGTGQTELKPALTDTDHFLLVPAAGTHLSTGDSAGMPQLFDGTPVVESGSNSDGNWIKFADGTQIQRAKLSGYSWGNNASSSVTWTFPVPFFDSDSISVFVNGETINPHLYNVSASAPTTTSASTHFGGEVANSALARAFASGRWK